MLYLAPKLNSTNVSHFLELLMWSRCNCPFSHNSFLPLAYLNLHTVYNSINILKFTGSARWVDQPPPPHLGQRQWKSGGGQWPCGIPVSPQAGDAAFGSAALHWVSGELLCIVSFQSPIRKQVLNCAVKQKQKLHHNSYLCTQVCGQVVCIKSFT